MSLHCNDNRLNDWYWLRHKIRCALSPDEPRLVSHLLFDARDLVRQGDLPPWQLFESVFDLLLDTACDHALPWHWRCHCLDHVWQPLRELGRLAGHPAEQLRLRLMTQRLLGVQMQPSLSYSDH